MRQLFVLTQNSPLLPPPACRDLKSWHSDGEVDDEAARDPVTSAEIRARILLRAAERADCGGANAAPGAEPPDGATLFKQQCATCHTTNLNDPTRQGPSLFNIIGRRAGTMEGFHYSMGFAKADFAWDEATLDSWIANPQEMIPGSVMAYRQARSEIRAAIIAYLRELH